MGTRCTKEVTSGIFNPLARKQNSRCCSVKDNEKGKKRDRVTKSMIGEGRGILHERVLLYIYIKILKAGKRE